MEVKHSYDGSDLTGSGVVSQISWERIKPFLEKAFYIKSGEAIRGIEVGELGVKCYIKSVKSTEKKL